MRKIIFNLHLYLSLTTGVFLAVICASGMLLVFELQMDRWIDRDVSYVTPQADTVSYTAIEAKLRAAYPTAQVTEYDIGGPGTTVIARMSAGPTKFRAYVDPYRGEIAGTRPGEPPSYWLRHLHRELIGGEVGTQVVRFTTFVVLLQSLSGIYLWWPLKRTTVKWSASWRRINIEFHHVSGFFSSALICILAVTGLLKGYNDPLQPVFERLTGTSAVNKAMPSRQPVAGVAVPRVTMDEALATAQRRLPGAVAARLTPPKGPSGSFLVTMKFPGDSTAPGRSWVVIDRYSGDILGSQDARTAPMAARIPIINRGIHVGGIFGAPTRVLVFLVALALLLQLFTGIAMWWRRRSLKSAAPATNAAALMVHSSRG